MFQRIDDNFFELGNHSLKATVMASKIHKELNVQVPLVEVFKRSDGTSMGIFIREFMALYEGKELPPLRIQYKNFSEWQNRQERIKTLKKQEKYWLKEFGRRCPAIEFAH